MPYSYLFLLAIVTFLTSCENTFQKEERISKKYCGSCHLFPSPDLLDKKTWEKSVLPEMAFRMGLPVQGFLEKISPYDLSKVAGTIPSSPMVSDEEWNAIT